MKDWNKKAITDFLCKNPGMKFVSLTLTQAVLEGIYHLSAHHSIGGNVDYDYKLRIEIPAAFPKEIPIVREISNKIPRDDHHHVSRDIINYTDNLCLGSRIRVLQKINENPTISGFIEKCVVPFLYANASDDFVFGELEHGWDGILDDYKEIFSVSTNEQVLKILLCVSKKKRIANKQLCPCGCKRRLGKCNLHNKINEIRYLASRNSFKVEYNNIVKARKYKTINNLGLTGRV